MEARLGWFSSILPQTRSITHICRTRNRIHHLAYGSFSLLSSSIYKWVFSAAYKWVFSAAAGAENLAQTASKPVPFWLSKIVDFDSKSTIRFVRRFRQQNQGEHGFPYRACRLFALYVAYRTDFKTPSIPPQGKRRRFGSYQMVNNRLNN